MSPDAASHNPRRRPDVESVDVDGELVLWDPRGRKVHRLDPIGSLLWPFLDGQTSLDELAEDASDVWGVPRQQARDALDGLVEQLTSAGLLEDAPTPVEQAPHGYLVDPPSP